MNLIDYRHFEFVDKKTVSFFIKFLSKKKIKSNDFTGNLSKIFYSLNDLHLHNHQTPFLQSDSENYVRTIDTLKLVMNLYLREKINPKNQSEYLFILAMSHCLPLYYGLLMKNSIPKKLLNKVDFYTSLTNRHLILSRKYLMPYKNEFKSCCSNPFLSYCRLVNLTCKAYNTLLLVRNEGDRGQYANFLKQNSRSIFVIDFPLVLDIQFAYTYLYKKNEFKLNMRRINSLMKSLNSAGSIYNFLNPNHEENA